MTAEATKCEAKKRPVERRSSPTPFCPVLSHSSCLPSPSLLRRRCPGADTKQVRRYVRPGQVPASTSLALFLPLSHASCMLSLSDSEQGPLPPTAHLFFQSPIDAATARVASVHSITTQQSSGSTGPGRNAFLLFSFHSTTRLLPKTSLSPLLLSCSYPVPVSHTNATPLLRRTHAFALALTRALPSTFPTLSSTFTTSSPPHHRITSQNLDQASHHPPCGFETHTHTNTPSSACQISIDLPYTSQISSLATSPPKPAHATVVTSLTPTTHNVGTSGQR